MFVILLKKIFFFSINKVSFNLCDRKVVDVIILKDFIIFVKKYVL